MKSSHSERIDIAKTPEARACDRVAVWRIVAPLAILMAVTALTGCSPFRGLRENLQYNDSMNDFVMGWRNSAWARNAWHDRKYMYVDEPQFVTFGEGFRDGYADVAGGANGCVPAIPPRKFWTWKYQTGEGQAKVAAWFAGYPYGAQAAKEDGAGDFQQIQVSHLIEAEYSQEFRDGKCPGCDPNHLPAAPGVELLPDGRDPTPELKPAPASAAPMSDPTTQVMPAGGWRSGMMTRIPLTTPAYFPNTTGAVIPASAQFPTQ